MVTSYAIILYHNRLKAMNKVLKIFFQRQSRQAWIHCKKTKPKSYYQLTLESGWKDLPLNETVRSIAVCLFQDLNRSMIQNAK